MRYSAHIYRMEIIPGQSFRASFSISVARVISIYFNGDNRSCAPLGLDFNRFIFTCTTSGESVNFFTRYLCHVIKYACKTWSDPVQSAFAGFIQHTPDRSFLVNFADITDRQIQKKVQISSSYWWRFLTATSAHCPLQGWISGLLSHSYMLIIILKKYFLLVKL